MSGGSSVSSTSFMQTAARCQGFGFALQRNDSSDNSTSFREHFSHNENSGIPLTHPRQETDDLGSKRLRRTYLESRKQAVHETLALWCHSALAFVIVSHSLLFTLSEDPGCAGGTTEISEE